MTFDEINIGGLVVKMPAVDKKTAQAVVKLSELIDSCPPEQRYNAYRDVVHQMGYELVGGAFVKRQGK